MQRCLCLLLYSYLVCTPFNIISINPFCARLISYITY
nr:MAG TPA: hypothetical protein [Caudoviricetes sp.]